MTDTGIDPARVRELERIENDRFIAERPRSMARIGRARSTMPRGVPMAWMDDLYEHPPVFVDSGQGAHFLDVDGHTYLDMYIGDMSAFCGHAPPPVVDAVACRMALGSHFLLPGRRLERRDLALKGKSTTTSVLVMPAVEISTALR